jgi:hypothetical protein
MQSGDCGPLFAGPGFGEFGAPGVSRISPGEEEPSGRRWGPEPTRCQRVSAERSLAGGGQRGDVLIDGREAGPHGVDAQMCGAGLAPGRDLLSDRR